MKQAHAAKADVLNCAVLLEYFCQTVIKPKSMNELWAYSEAARIPKKWTFGKYFGKEIAKTERGYLNWCLGQATMDQYVKLACKKALGLA